jgi:L-ascorbate metabolism protein UlaG (beta-lactamase superfamily)
MNQVYGGIDMGKELELGDVHVEWLGHASFTFSAGETLVYIDPYKVSHGEKADLILITHDHYDHCDPSSVSTIRKEETVVVAPKICKEKLHGVVEIGPGKTIEKKGVSITAVPAYNKNKQFHPRGRGVGYVFSLAGKRIYHAGDTDSIPEMEGLGEIDLALLPIGGTYTMNPSEAAEAAKRIGAKITVPMHWGDIVGNRNDAEEFRRLAKVRVEILG